MLPRDVPASRAAAGMTTEVARATTLWAPSMGGAEGRAAAPDKDFWVRDKARDPARRACCPRRGRRDLRTESLFLALIPSRNSQAGSPPRDQRREFG